MQAGNLRKRILIQQRTPAVESAFGQQLISWTDVATLWCEIEALSGSQLAKAQSVYNETTHRITVRYQPLLANVKQVGSYRGVYTSGGIMYYFDIGASLNELERNRTVALMATEGLNDGQ